MHMDAELWGKNQYIHIGDAKQSLKITTFLTRNCL